VKAEQERDRCHARLEIDHCFTLGENGQPVRDTIPLGERLGFPDAVECRDETIRLLEAGRNRQAERAEAAEARIQSVRGALGPTAWDAVALAEYCGELSGMGDGPCPYDELCGEYVCDQVGCIKDKADRARRAAQAHEGSASVAGAEAGLRESEGRGSAGIDGRPLGDTPWRRFGDEKPTYDGWGERYLLTWCTRTATYDIGCIDGQWSVGEAIEGRPGELWRWLDVNPERHLPAENNGPQSEAKPSAGNLAQDALKPDPEAHARGEE
jgi:hypothetical protein